MLQRPNACYIFEEQGVLGEDVRTVNMVDMVSTGHEHGRHGGHGHGGHGHGGLVHGCVYVLTF